MYPTWSLSFKRLDQNVVGTPISRGARGSLVLKALGYKPEGRGFETRWHETLNLPNHSCRTRP
jgi:hypothetical protein